MSTQTQIALMTPDALVAAAVTSALQSNGHVLAGPALRDPRDLLAQLGRAASPIVVVDLDPNPQEILRQLERIILRFPSSRFVALCSAVGNDVLLEAMQAGVRRVVVKQSMGAELSGVLDRLTGADAAEEGLQGQILTLLSASGGCGATTLAVNLAEELALLQKQPTLLCDLDSCYGAISSYLGLTPSYAADHVLNSEAIDGQLLRSTATVHNERLHVLASPASISYSGYEPLPLNRLEQVLESARQAYSNTIVDAPRIPIDAVATLVAGSAHTLLVLQLTVKDLRSARATLDALRQRGVNTDGIIPLANRYAKRQMIGLEEASKALGGIAVSSIRNDYTPAITGLNYGQCLSEAGPRSTLRKDLQELLTRLRESKAAQA